MIKKLLLFLIITTSPLIANAQSPGNNCAGAVVFNLPTVVGTTTSTGAQTTNGLGNTYAAGSYCTSANYGGGEDGVYSITVPTIGNYTFAFTSGNTWKILSIHTGCNPTTGNCIGGFTTGTGTTGNTTLTLPAGTYYLLIDTWPAPNFANFTLTATLNAPPPPPPVNDECINATPLTINPVCNYSFYTNASATASAGIPAPGCASYSDGDVWFSAVVNSTGELTVDMQSGSLTDSGMAFYSGTCSGTLTLIECDDDGSSNGAMSTITRTGLTPNETIYIRVWGYGNNNYGTFGICATSPIPQVANGAYVACPGDPSQPLTSTIFCQEGTSLGNTISGNLNAATDLVALQPLIFIESADPCGFDATDTSNYTIINFTVNISGTYVFAMDTPTPYFDAMGYIVINDGNFNPGSCASGTYIAGDDDDGPDLDPQITANLTAGVSYSLITTKFSFSSTTHTGPFTWNVYGPPTDIDWYTTAAGGTPIGSGASFDPVGVAGSTLIDTNSPGIYSFWAACPSNPNTRFQADYVIGKHWNGSTNNDWIVDDNWTPSGIPSNTDCIYIPISTFDPIVYEGNDGDGKNLTIQTGAGLTLESNNVLPSYATLTIVDYIDIQGTGTFLIKDGASLIQENDFPTIANNGDINMERITNIRRADYVYWSSPVVDFDINLLSSNTPNDFLFNWRPTVNRGVGGPPPGNTPIIYGEWEAYPFATSDDQIMDVGKGYIVRGPDGGIYNNVTSEDFMASFTGVPNNGEILHTITSGTYDGNNYTYDPDPAGGDILTVTKQDDNWNLIGNPYPSALNVDAFLNHIDNVNKIEGAIHLWTHGTNIFTNTNNVDSFYDDFVLNYNPADYLTHNGTGSIPNVFDGNIASGQGFFVAMNHSVAPISSIKFSNTMRSKNQNNSYFFRTNDNTSENDIERHRIWLDLISPSERASHTLIGYVEHATLEKDRYYDAYTLDYSTGLKLYSLIGEKAMVIQGRPVPFDNSDLVPLGFTTNETGIYTFAIKEIDGLFVTDNQDIFIEDTYTNTIHNVRISPYIFTVNETGTFNDRFVLRYTNQALGVGELETNELTIMAPNGDYIKVKSTLSPIQSVTIYDVLGRVLIDKKSINSSEFILNEKNLSDGTYIVKATLVNGKHKIQKVILKQ